MWQKPLTAVANIWLASIVAVPERPVTIWAGSSVCAASERVAHSAHGIVLISIDAEATVRISSASAIIPVTVAVLGALVGSLKIRV